MEKNGYYHCTRCNYKISKVPSPPQPPESPCYRRDKIYKHFEQKHETFYNELRKAEKLYPENENCNKLFFKCKICDICFIFVKRTIRTAKRRLSCHIMAQHDLQDDSDEEENPCPTDSESSEASEEDTNIETIHTEGKGMLQNRNELEMRSEHEDADKGKSPHPPVLDSEPSDKSNEDCLIETTEEHEVAVKEEFRLSNSPSSSPVSPRDVSLPEDLKTILTYSLSQFTEWVLQSYSSNDENVDMEELIANRDEEVGTNVENEVSAEGKSPPALDSGFSVKAEESPLSEIGEGGSVKDPDQEFQVSPRDASLPEELKTILRYSPSESTEWLMRKGLLRMDHRCTLHPGPAGDGVAYKLEILHSEGDQAVISSGGYVWVSECCPDKQISVFQGSIFEGSAYPPGTLMKLIYHWSCQTPNENITELVKVTSYYLNKFYTLLRSACVAGLHQNCPPMGGRGKYVEIGIVTVGTTSIQSGGGAAGQKQVLGVFDPASKTIRLKVIGNNKGVTDLNHDQISWPLNTWVDKRSVIIIDNSMDKALFEEMGFASVSQTKESGVAKSNTNVMNYLKNIVPKMFQNTRMILPDSAIQKFLDELSWREIWGGASTFDNIVTHLVQMTKADTGESLLCRLNKISLNPFQELSYSVPPTPADSLTDSIITGATTATSKQSGPSTSAANSMEGMIAANSTKQGGGDATTSIYSQQQTQNSGVGARVTPLDKSHEESRPPFKRKGATIQMAKPTKVTKPAAAAAHALAQQRANVTTLNSALAVPINPNEKFTFERANLSLLRLVKDSMCWECDQDASLPNHFTGGMKCNKCRYSTVCPVGMTRHSRIHHGVPTSSFPVGPQHPKPKMGQTYLCSCGFHSKYTDLMAKHMLECGEKVIVPYSDTQ